MRNKEKTVSLASLIADSSNHVKLINFITTFMILFISDNINLMIFLHGSKPRVFDSFSLGLLDRIGGRG